MKYLLLILPFMWGCAEKKEQRPIYVIAGKDTMVFYPNGNVDLTKCRGSSGKWVNAGTDSAHEVYLFTKHVLCDSVCESSFGCPPGFDSWYNDECPRWYNNATSVTRSIIVDGIRYDRVGPEIPKDENIQNPK